MSRTACFALSIVLSLSVVSCGSTDDETSGENGTGFDTAGSFDESQLPGDFPRHLIPPNYDAGNYLELGQIATASFESGRPVGETIEYYVERIGEPVQITGNDQSERVAQWDTTPWILSVIGKEDESIVAFSKLQE